MAIKSFRHKGLKNFFYKDDRSGLSPMYIDAIGDILDALDASHHPQDMRAIFGDQFAKKKGHAAGVYSVEVNGNTRITFEIEDDGAVVVDYVDYHGKKIAKR
ncbi:type II toxin-antitoxin system RelE/ParE family toxin [Aeromonas sp. 600282]|uniref:type II toxin-antitoxin system RelE/ParE family toxin n=1 Tax=Aeromonas sp. 600282 TaxID=2712027 RepID=UPI003B9E7981